MDDPVALILVLLVSAISITGLVLLNRYLGGWTRARLSSPEEAAERMAEDAVGFRGSEAVLGRDGAAALVLDADARRLGLVFARGSRFVTRALRPGELIAVTREGDTLTLHLADFTWPRFVTTLDDEETARRWAELAADYLAEESGPHARSA